MSITITSADVNGASGTSTDNKRFLLELSTGFTVLESTPITPANYAWSHSWNTAPLPAGSYQAKGKVLPPWDVIQNFDVVPATEALYPSSPFYVPVGANPTIDPNSANFVANFLAQGSWANKPQGTEFTQNDWTRPFYIATSSDPIYTVRQGDTGGWVDPNTEGDTIHVPAGARPAGGQYSQQLDGGVVIQQPDGWVYSMWRSRDPVDGHCAQCAKIESTGNGAYHDGLGGIGQAKLGPRQGQVTYDELVTAGEIPHALFSSVRNWHGRRFPGWPGDSKDSTRGGYVSDTNALPMGGHLYLAYSPSEIAALNIPAWKKVLVTAMAEYGIYTYDNGSSAHSLDWESGIPSIIETGTNRWVEWAQSVGIQQNANGYYPVDIQSGVDWSRLRALPAPSA